jgi:hypothetical protein
LIEFDGMASPRQSSRRLAMRQMKAWPRLPSRLRRGDGSQKRLARTNAAASLLQMSAPHRPER